MLIEHIHVRNFKSIKEATLNLEPLTVIVGANAAGKSNIINVFRFISNIITVGIDNAIALQGGIPYLTNACLKKGTPIEISFTVNLSIEKVFVVQFEIESWYYAGASEDDCHKLKLRHFIFCTDNLTKEEFQSKLVRTSDKKYIMDSLLDIYSLQYAVTRNHSLMIFTQAVYEKAYSAVS